MGRHLKIRILGQGKSLKLGEDLLTLTETPSQIPTNLEEVDKDAIGYKLKRNYMANLWSTKDLLG